MPATIGALQASVSYWVLAEQGIRVSTLPSPAWLFILLEFAQWMSWALLTPAIFAITRRWPLRRPRAMRHVAVHVVMALLIAFLMESIWFGIRLPFRLAAEGYAMTPAVAQRLYLPLILGRLVANAFIYATVVGIASALAFQHYLRERTTQAAALKTRLASAQVQALKMQLQPHFLFNTFHAIGVLMREDVAGAERMLARLGDLLRLTLSRAEHAEVTLRDELHLLRLYLEIEEVRFQDRLTVVYEVAPDTDTALVPDLVLQPLTENAIRHGIGSIRGPATIVVRARRADTDLLLEIEDNGHGPDVDAAGHQERVGMGSTRKRLRAMYGDEFRFTIEQASPEGGCVVRLSIPYREAAPDQPWRDVGHAAAVPDA